jgi:glycosyltransferase involved in cell wall biosynthesis
MNPIPSDMRPHIVIVTGQHLSANPRVWKEANTLHRAGYRVTVLNIHYDAEKARQDSLLLDSGVRCIPVVNLIPGQSGFSDFYLSRIRRRLAFLLKRLLDIDSKRLLVYRPAKVLEYALAEKADLYICHQETGLIVGDSLLSRGRRVAIDMEDWYSRDYVNPLRAVRLLDAIEGRALRKAVFAVCPSEAMSMALASRHGLPERPTVVYNGFPIREGEGLEGFGKESDSLVWFSQVIGPGRGLETLVEAMALVGKPMKVHLVGQANPEFREWLESGFSKGVHRLVFHPPVDHGRLLQLISRFRIGLAIDESNTGSRDTTISNKILQYMQAGNLILATDTKGQKEVAAIIKDGICVVEAGNPADWARGIVRLSLHSESDADLQCDVFREHFSWEAQEPKLLALVEKALSVEGPYAVSEPSQR